MPLKTGLPHLLTSAEVAEILGIGVSSIKRWTDEGKLSTVRTPGGHRRYELAAIRRFAREYGHPAAAIVDERSELPEDLAAIRDALLAALEKADVATAYSIITSAEHEGVSALLDNVVGDTLRRIGELWEKGEWGIDAEHQASYIIADALEEMRSPRNSPDAPLALLISPPAEHHDLPLRMLRVLLEHHGWRTRYLGANMPWKSTAAAVSRVAPALVAMSARSSEPFETERFVELCSEWRAAGAEVAIGGEWARGGARHVAGALRFRTLQGFEKWLKRSFK